MPCATITSLTDEGIDDLLYFARTGQLEEFRTFVEAFARTWKTSHSEVFGAAIEKQSGNSPLHMASANGHVDVLDYLLTTIHATPQEVRASMLNVQNASGNTPLHWASLNGHLEAVKMLMAAGADPSVMNQAGHDAVYEAEINSKNAVVEWLLTEGEGFGSGCAVDKDSNAADDQIDETVDGHKIDQDMEKLTVE